MEVDVTELVELHLNGEMPARLCSGSRSELGDNAAGITWDNSCKVAREHSIVNDDNREEIVNHFLGYGAWERAEVETDVENFAVQEVMSAIRQLEGEEIDLSEPVTEEDFRAATEHEGGMLWPDNEGKWYFYSGM